MDDLIDISAKKKLELSQLRILTTNSLRLFGCLLYNYDTQFIETSSLFTETMTQETKNIIKDLVTAEANIINGKPTITFHSAFIDTCDVEELTFVVLHEIIHILDKHITPSNIYTLLNLHNLACDHIINTTIKKDIDAGVIKKVKVPESAFIIYELLNDKNYTTVLEVYNWLIKNSTQNGIVSLGNGLEMHTIAINGKKITVIEDIQKTSSMEEIKTNIEVVDALQAEARSILDTIGDLLKGDTSGSAINDLVKKIIEVEIPWTSLLDKSISQKIIPDDTNLSWKGLQKRPYALGLYYPVTDITEVPSQLILVEDQSGSISKMDMKKFGSVLLQSIRYFDEVRIMKHDVGIHHDKTYLTSQTTIDDLMFVIGGRGGTSHRQVFDRIQKSFENGDDLSLIIMLTDYDSDIEELWSKFSWTKNIPVSIVCTNINKKINPMVDRKPIYIK